MNNSPLTIAQIFGALKRHQLEAFFTWFLVMVLVVGAFLVWPRKYGSEGALYVKVGRNNSTITPGKVSGGLTIQDTRETEIRSVVEIMKSPAVLEAVVEEIGAEAILKSRWDDFVPEISLPNFFASKSEGGMSVEEYDDLKKRELAIKKLYSDVSVKAEKKTSIVNVFVKGSSAKLAQQIVASVLRHADKVHLKVHAAEGSRVFFEEEMRKQKALVNLAEEALSEYRDSLNVVSVGDERATLQTVISKLRTELLDAESTLAQSEKQLEKLTEVMAKTEAQIAIPKSGVERLSYEDSRTEVFKLESRLEGLLSRFQRTHPEVQTVQSQLDNLRNSLQAMSEDRTESVMQSNPVYEQMQVDFLRSKVQRTAAQARVDGLKKMQANTLKKLPALNEAANVSQRLQRNIEIAQRDLYIYSEKSGEAKALASLDEKQMSDLEVFVEPTFRVKHISPKGSLIIPLGFICGLLSALGLVLFLERNNLSASYSEGEVEQILDLPVLVTLPRVYSTRNMVN
jgi:uncharacterized protein involved in exopolysaccharide biosynthesis